MRTLAIFIVCLLTQFVTQAQEEKSTYTVTIHVNNFLNEKGHALIGLHNQETFMKGKGIEGYKKEITDGKVQVTFDNVKPGTYAIMVLHDENDNNHMDFDGSGMPAESYGMSNNPMLFGPPSFNDAKFEVTDQDIEMTVRF